MTLLRAIIDGFARLTISPAPLAIPPEDDWAAVGRDFDTIISEHIDILKRHHAKPEIVALAESLRSDRRTKP